MTVLPAASSAPISISNLDHSRAKLKARPKNFFPDRYWRAAARGNRVAGIALLVVGCASEAIRADCRPPFHRKTRMRRKVRPGRSRLSSDSSIVPSDFSNDAATRAVSISARCGLVDSCAGFAQQSQPRVSTVAGGDSTLESEIQKLWPRYWSDDSIVSERHRPFSDRPVQRVCRHPLPIHRVASAKTRS